MKNIKEISRGNNNISLEFIAKSDKGSISFTNGAFNIGDVKQGNYFSIEKDGTFVSEGSGTAWDEVANSMVGQNVFTSVGRIDYDYDNLTVDYTETARYPEEFVGIVSQMPHRRRNNSEIRPHVHWLQNSDNMPNILISFRSYNNGETPGAWTLKALTAADNLFTWNGVGMQQITEFNLDAAVGESLGISGTFECKVYRDSANVSGLFAGADSYTGNWEVKYYDVHFLVDMLGSRDEFIK